jgi:hypothetical protein
MTYMRSLKSHRLNSHTWLGLNPQIGRPLSRIVGAIGFFSGTTDLLWVQSPQAFFFISFGIIRLQETFEKKSRVEGSP